MNRLDALRERREALSRRAERERERLAAAAAPYAAGIRRTVTAVSTVRRVLRSGWWIIAPVGLMILGRVGPASLARRAVTAYELWRGARGVYRAIFSARRGR